MAESKTKPRILMESSGIIWMPFKNRGGMSCLSTFKETGKELVLSGANSINQSCRTALKQLNQSLTHKWPEPETF